MKVRWDSMCVFIIIVWQILPQPSWLKITNSYYIAVSAGQEFSSGFAAWFRLRVSPGQGQNIGSVGITRCLPQAAEGRTLCSSPPPGMYLSVHPPSQLPQNEWSKREEKANDPVSRVTRHRFCFVSGVRSRSLSPNHSQRERVSVHLPKGGWPKNPGTYF